MMERWGNIIRNSRTNKDERGESNKKLEMIAKYIGEPRNVSMLGYSKINGYIWEYC